VIAARIFLSGVVAASATTAPATFTGQVDNASLTPATLTGTVSRALVDSFEATSIRTGFKVKLDGAWIPQEDLAGELQITELLDSPAVLFSFGLVGVEYSAMATRKTWTRVPVEVWLVNGLAGAEREELRVAGYVASCDQESDVGEARVRVSCQDHSILYQGYEICYELEPLAGRTRGSILAEICGQAGIATVDTPDGAEYTKGVQAIAPKLFDWLRPFVEPEGWKLRFQPDGALRVYTSSVKLPPTPADDTWDLSTLQSVRIEPPRDVASRWVFRGFTAVFVDEVGQETKQTVLEVSELYAPKIAVEQQDTSGVVTSTSFPPFSASLRVVQRITDTKVSRGGKPLSQETVEEGWYNRRAAHQITNTGTGGYSYLQVYIDEAGEYVELWRETFREKERRLAVYGYDGAGQNSSLTLQVFRYYLQPSGVEQTPFVDYVTVVGAYVFGDSDSYGSQYEQWGLAEEHISTRTFADTGEIAYEETASFGYVPLVSAVDPAPSSLYVRSSGVGQSELLASWRQYATQGKRTFVVDGTLVGEIETQHALAVYQMKEGFGAYGFGGYSSNQYVEQLRLVNVRSSQYDVVNGNTWEKVTYEPGKEPVRQTFSGQVPQPQYKSSPWTLLRQNPIELVIDDPLVESWFGFAREVVQNDHVQSDEEADFVLRERRARELARHVTVTRRESFLRPGSTVLLKHPGHALGHRGWMVASRIRRAMAPPSQVAEYEFEVAL